MNPDTASLWERFHAELHAFVLRRVDSEATAEDILQSAFLRAHRSLEAGEAPEQPRAWLYQIVRNLIVDGRRRTARQRAVAEAAATDPTLETGTDADDEAFLVVARSLPMFVDALEPAYRDALRMTDLEGLTQDEAARRAGISLSGMKSRVQRGRKQVFDLLQECCEFDVDARGHMIACRNRRRRDCC